MYKNILLLCVLSSAVCHGADIDYAGCICPASRPNHKHTHAKGNNKLPSKDQLLYDMRSKHDKGGTFKVGGIMTHEQMEAQRGLRKIIRDNHLKQPSLCGAMAEACCGIIQECFCCGRDRQHDDND